MSMRFVCVAATAAGLLSAAAMGQFNAGNLVILSATNNGTNGNVNSSGAAVSLLEYTTAGSATGYSFVFPSSGTGNRLVISGSSTTEGQLQWSANGAALMVAGYSGNRDQFGSAGTNSIATLTSAVLPRMAAAVDINGNATYMPITNSFSTNNVRGAASFDGVTAYVSGTSQPIRTITAAAAGTSTAFSSGGASSWRTVNIYNGTVYASTQTNTTGGGAPYTGIYQFDALGVASLLPGFPAITGTSGPSPEDFMFASPSLLYVADDRTVANGGGLQRWDLNAGLWSLTYTMSGGLTNGLRSVTMDPSTGAIYAIAAGTGAGTPTSLVAAFDTGAGSTFTTLATSSTLTVWRGVEFVPTPGTGALLGCGLLAASRRRRV